jgi:hypothetical protein
MSLGRRPPPPGHPHADAEDTTHHRHPIPGRRRRSQAIRSSADGRVEPGIRFLHRRLVPTWPRCAEITSFIEQCRDRDTERAQRCHELLEDLTATI